MIGLEYLSTSSPESSFCTLEYRPSRSGVTESIVDGKIIALLIDGHEAPLSLFVMPKLREIVREDDLPYIDSLLVDFSKRCNVHPEGLFQQASSLSVGPIVTHRTGVLPADRDYLRTHCPDFQLFAPAKR